MHLENIFLYLNIYYWIDVEVKKNICARVFRNDSSGSSDKKK